MDRQIIFYVIIILVFSLGLFWLVIFLTIAKQKDLIRQARKCINDQQNTIVIRLIKRLDEPNYYYRKQYTHQIVGIDIYTKEEIVLYVTESDSKDFVEKDEYQVNHDGVVVLEYKKNYF